MVQLNFTQEIEVFYMLFNRSLSIFIISYLKHHIEYMNFRCVLRELAPAAGLREPGRGITQPSLQLLAEYCRKHSPHLGGRGGGLLARSLLSLKTLALIKLKL